MKINLAATSLGASCVTSNMYSRGWLNWGFAFYLFLLPLLFQPKPAAAQSTPPEWAWAKQAGDHASSITTVSGGHVYVAGTFSGTAEFGSISLTSSGATDVFIAKYDGAGEILWARQVGGAAADRASVVATDAAGNLYVGGVFSGIVNFGAASLTSNGAEDAFIVKYNAAGNALWARQAGGTNSDSVRLLTVDASGHVNVAGAYRGNAVIGGALLTGNMFIAKYSASGSILWAKDAGGGAGGVADVAFDAAGNAHATGSFRGAITFGDITLTRPTDPEMFTDIYTVKYDVAGEVVWAKQMQSDNDGIFGAIASKVSVDASGSVYVAGKFSIRLRIDDISIERGGLEFSTHAFLAQYDGSGNAVRGNHVDGTNYNLEIVDLITQGDNAYLAYNYRGSLGSPSNLHLKIATYGVSGSVGLTIEERAEETSEYEDALPVKNMFVDADGRIYVTYSFFGTAQIGDFTLASDNFSNLFTTIYNAEGRAIWAQQVETTDIAEASDGVYMAGSFKGTATFGAATLTSSGDTDAFLAKAYYSALENPYCVPAMAAGCADDNFIGYFAFAGIYYNAVGQGCQNDNSYTNFYPFYDIWNESNYISTVKQGQSYPISLRSEPEYGNTAQEQAYGVWIDYNDDKDFDDPGEFVYSSPEVGAEFSGTVTIPADASLGVRRLRVRSRPEVVFTASESCTAGTYGETQDYTIAIGYCAPYSILGCDNGSYIRKFSFNTLVNNSGCNGEGGYISYEPTGTRTTTVAKGQSYSVSIQSGPVAQAFGVWIDYNNDTDFDDDGELVYASPIVGEDYVEEGWLVSPSVSTEVYNGTIIIPASAAAGVVRMRVRSNSFPFSRGESCSLYNPDPVGPDSDSYLYGETEDYTITIEEPEVDPPTLASFTPHQGLPGVTVTLSGTSLATTTSIRINGVEAVFSVNSDTELEAIVPATATTGRITVTTDGGEATSNRDLVVLQPSILVFAPWWGAEGTKVILFGRYLSTTSEVRFNGVPAHNFTIYNDYLVRATVPPGASTGKISLLLYGGAEAVSPWDFHVLWRPLALIASEATADTTVQETEKAPGLEEDVVAYPNPFYDGVTISAKLYQEGPVELLIFSELGQRVREIRYGQLGVGSHDLRWDGRDSQGIKVAHGLYFYQVVLGNRHLSGKLLKSKAGR